MTIKLEEYLEISEILARPKNLIETSLGSLFYLPEWGVDKEILSGMNQTIQKEAAGSYFRQMAARNSIVLTSVAVVDEDFYANLTYNVES